MKKGNIRDATFYLLIAVVLISTIFLIKRTDPSESYTYAEIRRLFTEEKVKEFFVEDNTLTLTLWEKFEGKDIISYDLLSFDLFFSDLNDLIKEQYEAGIITNYDYPAGWQAPWWWVFMPYVALVFIFIPSLDLPLQPEYRRRRRRPHGPLRQGAGAAGRRPEEKSHVR